ncbi:calcium-binding protein [Natrinema salinisoli]|uniref:calcium-binding protein n=1 Tax=Natrinema salinisoli TaxID=2878535 RepID=UPI001CF05378|nr:calcium-binding protein [Natrinema salinisoli]
MSEQDTTGDSRRSFMAKGALATGALTLGTGAFGTATVGAQENEVAVFASGFFPGAEFTVLDELQTSTTVEVLQLEGETVDEISQPDEWTGHIIRYEIGSESGITTFMFVRGGSLSAGDSGTIASDASVLSPDLNLINTSLNGDDVETDETDETDEMNETEETEETDDNGVDVNVTTDENGGE